MIFRALNYLFVAIDNAARWWLRRARPPCRRCGHEWKSHGMMRGVNCAVYYFRDAGNNWCECRRYEAAPGHVRGTR
jgi:hypothetical protein